MLLIRDIIYCRPGKVPTHVEKLLGVSKLAPEEGGRARTSRYLPHAQNTQQRDHDEHSQCDHRHSDQRA